MRHVPPPRALRAYLDDELPGRAPRASGPLSAAAPARPRLARAAAWLAVLAGVLAVALLGAVAIALAQDEPMAPAWCETPTTIGHPGPEPSRERSGRHVHPPPVDRAVRTVRVRAAGPGGPDERSSAPSPTASAVDIGLGAGGCLLLLVALLMPWSPPLLRRARALLRTRNLARGSVVETRPGGRARNEDYGLARRIRGCEVLLVADGLGGHIGGARAARIAVESAARHLEHALARARDVDGDVVEDAVRGAFARAARALAVEDDDLGLGARSIDGLRTTLIVLVAVRREYIVGALGDGAAVVHREDGRVDALMRARNPDSDPTVLVASLGPVTDGVVDIVRAPCLSGDIAFVATDGIADRVLGDFWRGAALYVAEAEALHEAATEILDEFEKTAPSDNVTLGVAAAG